MVYSPGFKAGPVRFQKQAFRHKPDEGLYGDCDRTVIACLLGMDRDDVPHWNNGPDEHWETVGRKMRTDFLLSRGLVAICYPYAPEHIDETREAMEEHFPRLHYLFAGLSRTGVNHAVIGRGRDIVWDPSLTDAGIIGPCKDGLYRIEFLVAAVGMVP